MSHLASAMAEGAPQIFVDHVAWTREVLEARGISVADLSGSLGTLKEVLAENLAEDLAGTANNCIERALAALAGTPVAPLKPFIVEDEPLGSLASSYLSALLRGERRLASRLVLDAVNSGAAIRDIYLHVFQRSQYEIGRLWQLNRVTVAQEHYATAATQLVMSQLYPLTFSTERNGRTMVVACVANELHEIGARMVADFFEMEGWDTHFLGSNVPVEGIVDTLVRRKAELLGISATMALHVGHVTAVVKAVKSSPLLKAVKVVVGGSGFNKIPGMWRHTEADGFALGATEALKVADELLSQKAEA